MSGAILRVDKDSTAVNPDGTTWSLAFPDVQDVLDYIEANGGSHDLWIADGVYFPSKEAIPGTATSVTFKMPPGVKWFGGFQGISRPGGGETQLNQRNVDLYPTILDGNIGNPSISTDNAQKVVTAEGSGITQSARLNGLTIRDALSFGLWIREGATPLVIRCTFTENNTAESSGSAVRLRRGQCQ